MERMRLRKPVEIVMGNTGKVADTKIVVAGVKERKKRNLKNTRRLFQDADQLARNARKQLEDFNLEKVGAYMNENHKLLQEIGVSSPELDTLVAGPGHMVLKERSLPEGEGEVTWLHLRREENFRGGWRTRSNAMVPRRFAP